MIEQVIFEKHEYELYVKKREQERDALAQAMQSGKIVQITTFLYGHQKIGVVTENEAIKNIMLKMSVKEFKKYKKELQREKKGLQRKWGFKT